MSLLAKIQGGAVLRYPYTLDELRADNPRTSFPAVIPPAALAEFGAVEIAQTGQPAHDPLTQVVEEAMPVLINGAWTQVWSVRPATAAERTARAQAVQKALVDAVQTHLDATAKTHGYDGILSLASYAASNNPPFAIEGLAGADWRDAVWLYCYGVLAAVQAGTRPVPSAEELVAELPALVWPS